MRLRAINSFQNAQTVGRGVLTAPQTSPPHGSLGQRALPLLAVAVLFFIGTVGASAESLLLSNAIVHTVSGETLTHGQVLINGNKIQAVGTNLTQSANKVVDLNGQHLYPGLIALDSALGLTEIEAVRSTRDMAEVGDYRPDVQSWIAVNPDSELLPVSRANGIAHAEPAPQGGVMGGLSGVIALDGWTTEQMTIKRPAAFHVYWPEMTLDTKPKEKFKDQSKYKSLEDQAKERTAKINALDDFFHEAHAYAKERDAIKKNGTPDPGINPPWEAMLPVVRGEIPIMVHAEEFRQIKAALRWAQTNQYKIVLVGGNEAWMAVDVLSSSKVPVIFENVFKQPTHDWDAYDVHFRTPELLRRAGVKVAFSEGADSFNAALTKNLPYSAAQAVAFGLPEEEAIKGMTLYPAQLLNMADRLGSIEPGKEATLFVADGSILDIRANVKQMWIAGKEVSLESRHTRLYEKYKNRPRTK
ncbi:MAG: Amidohydrolase [Pedosphaera sp.]|nr:Amidohydrolase [Pedosphaera sp.]